jgi:hypothetical protein
VAFGTVDTAVCSDIFGVAWVFVAQTEEDFKRWTFCHFSHYNLGGSYIYTHKLRYTPII